MTSRVPTRCSCIEQEEQTRRAIAEERATIARELHDVVAHAISVTVLQSRGARRMLGRDESQVRRALDAIEHTNTQALGDMRRLLAVLRDTEGDAATTPQPSLARLDDLVADVRDSGLAVELVESGEDRDVPPGVDLSAYRIIQEALTNVLKHASAASATVRLDYGDGRADGCRCATTAPVPSSPNGHGHGLVGIRERVAVVGGEIETGPAAGGGFEVMRPAALLGGAPMISRGHRRRPAAGPRRTADDPRHRARPGGRRRGGQRGRGVELCARARPDVVLMDVRMPVMDGIEATRLVTAVDDPPRVLVLTTFDLDEVVYDALRAGASGFLLKDAPEDRLTTAIRVVADGGSLFAPSVTRRLIEEFAKRSDAPPASLDGAHRARGGGAAAGGARDEQRRDRRRAVHHREHGQDARGADADEAGLRDRVQAVVVAYESGLIRPGGRVRRLDRWTSSGTPSGRPGCSTPRSAT